MRLNEVARRTGAAAEEAEKYPPKFQPFMHQFLMYGAFIDTSGQEGWAYSTYQELLVDLGTLRQQSIHVPDLPVLRRAEPQACYLNAYHAVLEIPEYTYVEGYAQTNLLVVRHAWLEGPGGEIIDPTWALPGPLEATPPEVVPTYFGIRIHRDFVFERALKTGLSSVLDDWRDGHPSLRWGFELNDEGLVIDYNQGAAHVRQA